MKEYQFIYKTSYAKDLADILAAANLEADDQVLGEIKEIIHEEMGKAGVHFGHPYLNTATMAGINRIALKTLAEKYNVEFPIKREETLPTTPWWIQC